jgi:uncharacterized protein YkwD
MRIRLMTRPFIFVLVVASAGAAVAPAGAAADLLDDINAVRMAGCGGQGPGTALQQRSGLNRAAERVAMGASPNEAALAAGYVARRVASIHLQGFDAARLKEGLTRTSCAILADPDYHDVGLSRQGDHVWLVLAAERGVPGEAAAVSARVLRLVNAARAQPRACGNQQFAAAGPLALSATLGRAALLHAQDMAAHSFLAHVGRDGRTPAERVTQAGYGWTRVGENVAAGAGSAEEVTAEWLASPGHCANIMSADFTEFGVAFALNSKDKYGVYWAMSLAAPR